MKNKYLIPLLLCLAMPQLATSQAAILAMIFGDKVASEKFNLSLEAGVPFNYYSDVPNSKVATGVNFGIGGNLKLSDTWFMSPNVYFLSKRNLSINPSSLNSGVPELDNLYQDKHADIVVGCTDLHILFAYQPRNTNFRIGISPQVSFLKNSTATYTSDEGTFIQDLDPYTTNIDYGIITNIGYNFQAGNRGKGIHVNLRYYHGFKDIFDESFATGNNQASYWSIHFSLPFITDELAAKNVKPIGE